MAYPPITNLPTPPQRDGSQTPAQFSSATDAWLTAQNGMVTELNSFGDYIDTTAAEVDADAQSAALNATAAENSSALANFKGLWSSLSGSLSKPSSVLHNNSYWALLNNLVDVTASEPSPSNSDWALISYQGWNVGVDSSVTIGLNSFIIATAFGGDITLTSAAFGESVFVTIKNSNQSDSLVKYTIPAGMTVYGKVSEAVGGDLITMRPGESMQIVAKSATVGELI